MNGIGLLTIEDVIKAIYVEIKKSEIGHNIIELCETETLKDFVQSFVESSMFKRTNDVKEMVSDCIHYIATLMR